MEMTDRFNCIQFVLVRRRLRLLKYDLSFYGHDRVRGLLPPAEVKKTLQ